VAARAANAAAATASRATSVSLARVAKADLRIRAVEDNASKAASRAAVKLGAAKAAAVASAAEAASLFAGGQDGTRLSRKGKKRAAELFGECGTQIERLKRLAESQRISALRAEAKAEAAVASEVSSNRSLLTNPAIQYTTHCHIIINAVCPCRPYLSQARQRKLKNAALSAKRKAVKSETKAVEKKLSAKKKASMECVRSKCNSAKLPAAIRARLEGAEADTAEAETALEAAEEKIDSLNAIIDALRSNLDPVSKIAFDQFLPDLHLDQPATPSLITFLGKGGKGYSQETIELGFRLMSACLSGEQAVSVVRAFAALLHPHAVEGLDYRVPCARRFNEWRRYLEPICHFIAVTTIELANETHCMNDATTKKHKHILLAVYRCVLPGDIVVDVVIIFRAQLSYSEFDFFSLLIP
jgi:hypothetical protein